MILTAPQGQSLTPEDLAFFDAHPNLTRLAVKAYRIEIDPTLTDFQRHKTLLLWACELLNLDDLRWQALAARHRDETNEKAKGKN